MSKTVQCELCPRYCIIMPGQSGECRVRVNIEGRLTSVVYGFPCSINVDPIEKKPCFHFLPGTKSLSIATVGCNLHCLNCQNWEISQANPEDSEAYSCPPDQIVDNAVKYSCTTISYTYTDPVVFYEYVLDTAKLAHEKKIRNVLVTAGYINTPPWKKLLKHVDAARIDLKGMTEEFYRKVPQATLQPVLDALVTAKESGVHVEIINLLIPTLNDSQDEIRKLVRWIVKNIGADTPLHFSRFFPIYKMKNLPPTPLETLDLARKMAMEEGLNYVYIGNIASREGQNTYCPKCSRLLIERNGYTLLQNNLKDGKCPCGREIYGVWK
ncbi:MAG TPA: AmmeMemoRadiSam system radical SAM enzyme [Lentisphaeria bacterium]|nr:MAG: AmmeMemoRadiSam system radical SAM enzyme [Lentisphaerae bacterium GWF2_50_93]HCE45964.1 AmmeMemoRadiSam system radical SAM enzyme [Lentisphaeria bacterium]